MCVSGESESVGVCVSGESELVAVFSVESDELVCERRGSDACVA